MLSWKSGFRSGLSLWSLAGLVACSVPTETATGTTDTGSAQLSASLTEDVRSNGDVQLTQEAKHAVSARLAEPRLLVGTGIEVALPKGAVRVGRGELVFQLAGAKSLSIALAHQSSSSSAAAALDRAVLVFSSRREFELAGDPYPLSETPARFAAFGSMTEDVLGNPVTAQQALISTVADGGHLLFLRANFPAQDRALAEAVAATLKVHPEATLDPFGVHGIELLLPEGYELKPHQLHPIVVLPKGGQASEGQPMVDLRVASPDRTEELLAELLRTFGADLQQTACAPAVTAHPDKPGEKYRQQTCKFESARAEYQVRLDVLEDALGGVVAITTVPDSGAEQHAAVFAKMTATLRLKQPSEL